ncbi:MAG: nitrophenyl compound nitroreductase subunit ArsF family protein, partial [Chloroflexi bacterium]|nr:nitrophenyl compound nitroreductase subunit ArsF family protein [Chloroflexota bacterium]
MIQIKTVLAFLIVACVLLIAGCSGSAPAASQPSAQPATTPNTTSPQQSISSNQSAPSTVETPATTQAPPVLASRIEVIYFHMTQRCVTCLCFEERTNYVIEKYFSDVISSGKLTYRVLNAQETQNAALAKKYKAVGSQLFINSVINGFDNIDDIQDIW